MFLAMEKLCLPACATHEAQSRAAAPRPGEGAPSRLRQCLDVAGKARSDASGPYWPGQLKALPQAGKAPPARQVKALPRASVTHGALCAQPQPVESLRPSSSLAATLARVSESLRV
ncbi:hypothetical protein Salat_1860200 [Sesamum alatum]|uniref:Uncharacterized protein n=1 Tax=Sesamum alatum TaxID=300844 RepID=A0AAE2CHX8_9LAMI|nr:hypothetical protein Salat_1860200 [Sesamum alatum]